MPLTLFIQPLRIHAMFSFSSTPKRRWSDGYMILLLSLFDQVLPFFFEKRRRSSVAKPPVEQNAIETERTNKEILQPSAHARSQRPSPAPTLQKSAPATFSSKCQEDPAQTRQKRYPLAALALIAPPPSPFLKGTLRQ
jgi:hypothetical protein